MVRGTFRKEWEHWEKAMWVHDDQVTAKSNQLFLAVITKLADQVACEREKKMHLDFSKATRKMSSDSLTGKLVTPSQPVLAYDYLAR